jgi:hypothetical protein
MKKQRRGKFTYIPKDEIAEVTTFNDVTFENDDLLDGAYVKGRKKYARGGVMKEMSLEQQAAFAVGNDVWFSLPDIEKAELVEELVKSGMITPTASETDVRIMELIEQDNYADGGKVITIGEDTWYLTYIDPTHFYLSNSPEFKGNAYHIGEFRGKEPQWLWNDVRSWLKSNPKMMADGGVMAEMMADGGMMSDGIDRRGVINQYSDEKLARIYSQMFYLDYSDVLIELKGNPEERKNIVNEIYKELQSFEEYRSSGMMADGGKVDYGGYTNKFASMKGGISYFSVDIDTEDGEQVRDLEFKSYEKAKKVYDKYKKSMEYDGQAIEDIQLIVNYKNGDYDSIGDSEMMADGGTTKLARGGFDVGRWYRDSSGEEFKYVGEDVKGNTLFSDGVKTLKKPIEDFGSSVKEEKLFSWFAKGGVATEGKFLVKYYLKESPNDFKEKIFDDRDKAEFFFETIQDDDDIVVMPIEEVVEKASAPTKSKNLFSAAKPVPVTKTAAKKRERVEVNGISELIRRYDELNAKIKDAEAAKSTIGGELKEIGREKFLDLYEERGFRPANFDLADGNENILLEVTDKYLKVEPEKAAMLEQFDGLLEVKTTYEFNAEILEKKVSDSMTVGDVVSMLIQDSKLLSDSDKENLIKAKTTMRVPKGTIDRLLEYDNPREVFNLISPILALK